MEDLGGDHSIVCYGHCRRWSFHSFHGPLWKLSEVDIQSPGPAMETRGGGVPIVSIAHYGKSRRWSFNSFHTLYGNSRRCTRSFHSFHSPLWKLSEVDIQSSAMETLGGGVSIVSIACDGNSRRWAINSLLWKPRELP